MVTPGSMRVLVVQLDRMHPPLHGSAAAAWRLLKALVDAGHEAHALSLYRDDDDGPGQSLGRLRASGIEPRVTAGGTVSFVHQGVHHHGVRADTGRGSAFSWRLLRQLAPERVLVSDEPLEITGRILARAAAWSPSRVWLWSHTVHHLPFGPLSLRPAAERTELLRRIAGVLVPSDAARDYVRQHLGHRAETLRLPLPEPAAETLDDPGPQVTLVNPCALKGLPIFLAVAEALPHRSFLAVPGWGTREDDRHALERAPNVRCMEWAPDFRTVLARTRVLLVPSLWFETFGLVALEATAHGVPVLASDVGGLPEALRGGSGLCPVAPMTLDPATRRPRFPPQDAGPWVTAVERLLDDEEAWTEARRRGLAAAASYRREHGPRASVQRLVGLGPDLG